MAEEEEKPPPKKRRLSLSLKGNRFARVSSESITSAKDGFVPANTDRSNNWAVTNFESWRTAHGSSFPTDILLTDDPSALCNCLCQYVMETRKQNGQPYPPKTIFNLLSGLQRYIRAKKPMKAFNIMDNKEGPFRPLHNVMDTHFRSLHSDGIGTNLTSSGIITFEEEDLLWSKEVVGVNSPTQLLHAVFYYCRLNFCLRGGDEHRALKLSQFTRLEKADPQYSHKTIAYYQYTEHGSKNNLGGVKQVRKRQPNKVVKHFANPSLGDRCLVRLLDLYISKRPKFKPDSSDSDAFYLRPMVGDYSCDDSEKQWFYARAIGDNTLKGMLKVMCKVAGISFEDKSNHSLLATSATRMMDAGLQEKVIMDRTGHHSLDGLKPYAGVTDLQQQQVSEVLEEKKDVGEACQKLQDSMNGIVTNNSMSGCTFNITFKI